MEREATDDDAHEKQHYSIKCRARLDICGDEWVDITVYSVDAQNDEEARAWAENRARLLFAKLEWDLVHLDVAKL